MVSSVFQGNMVSSHLSVSFLILHVYWPFFSIMHLSEKDCLDEESFFLIFSKKKKKCQLISGPKSPEQKFNRDSLTGFQVITFHKLDGSRSGLGFEGRNVAYWHDLLACVASEMIAQPQEPEAW